MTDQPTDLAAFIAEHAHPYDAEAVALFQHTQPDRLEPDAYREVIKIVAVRRMKTQTGL